MPKAETELVRGLTGVTPNTVDYKMIMSYKGYEFGQQRRGASTIFNSIAKRPNATREEILDAYIKGNEARFKAFNKFHRTIEDMKLLGYTDKDISKALKLAGVSCKSLKAIFKYKPLIPDSSIFKAMKQSGTFDRYPKEEIQRIIKNQIGRKYTSEIVEEEGEKIVVPKETNVSVKPQPNVESLNSVSSSNPFGYSTTIGNTGYIDPSLLGSNPIEAAKNMQIAKRKTP